MDIAIAGLIALFTCAIAYMGVHVTLHPPESAEEKRNWKIGFLAAAALICICVLIQAVRNGRQQGSMEKSIANLNGSLKDANEQLTKTNAALARSSLRQAFMQGQLSGLSLMVGKISNDSDANSRVFGKALTAIANGGTPRGVEPPAIQRMSNKQLRTKVLDFVNALRQACAEDITAEETQSSANNLPQNFRTLPRQDQQKIWRDQNNREIAQMNSFNLKLQQQFVGDSTVYRDELLRRLGPQNPAANNITWWKPSGMIFVGYWQALGTADYLEKLAKQLPK